jgi:hypothetical protein
METLGEELVKLEKYDLGMAKYIHKLQANS